MPTKAEVIAWRQQRGRNPWRQDYRIQAGGAVSDALDGDEKEVSATKRGHRSEVLRPAAIGDWKIQEKPFRDMKLVDATSEVLGKWRDHRLNTD